MDKKTLLLIVAGIVIVISAVAAVAVLRSRGDGFSFIKPADQIENNSGDQSSSDNKVAQTESENNRPPVVCGDGLCVPPENPVFCPYDCKHALLEEVGLSGKLGENIKVRWTTTEPTTSIVAYQVIAGEPEGFGSEFSDQYYELSDDELTTDHEIIIEDKTNSVILIEISGVDQAGKKHLLKETDMQRR